MQDAPLSPSMGGFDRLDSLDDYFLLNSPSDSLQPPMKTTGEMQQHSPAPYDRSVYYPGYRSSAIALQGNVQQSTSYVSVDRSNALDRNDSLGFGSLMPTTQREIDELLKTGDKDLGDLNLTELFLKSSHRNSLNENYQAKGVLKGHDNELHRKRSNSLSSSFLSENERNIDKDDNNVNELIINSMNATNVDKSIIEGSHNYSQEPSFELDLDIEPTPLSEIRAKSEHRKHLQEEASLQSSAWQPGQQQKLQQPTSFHGLTWQRLDQHQYEQDRQNRRQHSGNYYPFGRAYQLPIPTMPSISLPTKSESLMAPSPPDAAATTAAGASVYETVEENAAPPAAASNAPNQDSRHQLRSHTPPHSPPLQPANHPGCNDGIGPHRHSHSPSFAPQQHHSYSHHHPRPQHHPRHPSHSILPHQRPGSLAAGTVPEVMHDVSPKIIGPYTTAQQGGCTSNSSRRRTSAFIGTASHGSTSGSWNAVSVPAPPATRLPRRGHHMPREASDAHTKPNGVLAEAAKQRRGYSGFHKPATSQTTNTYHHPLPQKFSTYAAKATSTAWPATQSTTGPKKALPPAEHPGQPQVQPSPPKSDGSVTHHSLYQAAAEALVAQPTADTAYERKKQRAKDARVKLNESIERLHVAMGVAGTESKRRTELLRHFTKNAGREHENNTDHQAFDLMDSCVKTAESAKKWDRPSFVGSAATIISCLNSQCEILMKELVEFQQVKPAANGPGLPSSLPQEESPSELHEPNPKGSETPGPQHLVQQEIEGQQDESTGAKRNHDVQPAEDIMDGDSSGKRRRIIGVIHRGDGNKESCLPTDGTETDPVSKSLTICVLPGCTPIQFQECVMDLIASFLDPISLVRCCGVCKEWNRKGRSFEKDEAWIDWCFKIFGHLKTPHRQEKRSDDEVAGDHGLTRVERKSLYSAMRCSGTKPSIQFDGRSHLLVGRGELSCGGAVGWLFLVERSNGETMRSVKRNPAYETSCRNSGAYCSLPVVEIRIVIQNTGLKTPFGCRKDTTIGIKAQRLIVDASTRRRREELSDIDWDDKFASKLLNLDGSKYNGTGAGCDELAQLKLFDSVVLVAFIHASRCGTTAKFIQRSNYLKLLLSSNAMTQAMVIPITIEQAKL